MVLSIADARLGIVAGQQLALLAQRVVEIADAWGWLENMDSSNAAPKRRSQAAWHFGNREIRREPLMKRHHPAWWIFCLAIVLFLRDTPPCVDACCPAYRLGQEFRIADQRILIAWDPETKIEHFVREAAFKRPEQMQDANGQARQDTGRDFGFLVPSPSEPQIEEADASVFGSLDAKIQPRIEIKDRWSVNPFPLVLSPFLLASRSPSH